jgi:ribosomal protein S18 acetylase RimI-like enzyme
MRIMGFIVRPGQPEDFAALGEITVQVYRDLVPQVEAGRAYLAQMRDVQSRAEATELLVAVDDTTGDVLGGVSFVRSGGPYANAARPGEGEFRLLAVASAAQRRGVGERLVQACLDRAEKLGLDRMVIDTQPNMMPAHRLYQRLGFVRAPERDREPVPGLTLWAFTAELGPTEPA